MRDGRIVGTVLGVGAIVGVGLLLTRKASAATRGSPRERSIVPPSPEVPRGLRGQFPPSLTPAPEVPRGLRGQFQPLVERWRGEVEKRAQDLPVDAILEWIRIESGGDMCAVGNPNEVGIFQLFFPSDAKYGATLAGLRELCQKSRRQNPADISWLSESDFDMQVGAGIRKVLAARDTVRRVFAQSGVTWPEASFDFGSAVKQIHATPAVITELIPKIVKRDGTAPASWDDLRRRVMAFPPEQMGQGLRKLWNAPSKRGLRNRLEDTLRNAEIVGRAWGNAMRGGAAVGRERGSYV